MFTFLGLSSIFFCLLTFGLGFNSRSTRRLQQQSSKCRGARLHQSLTMRTLLIDNFDSYTYNIWQLLSEVNGEEPIVVYNNAFDYNWDELLLQLPKFDNIVISPGPGSPDVFSDFGICRDAILRSNLPVLGVCLGHQGIAHSFGATVNRAKVPMHGRLSSISHSNEGLFHNIPQDSKVVRYHSLVVENDSLPPELRATAWTADNVMMGLEHVSKPIYGVQFHPESISTACGKQLFSNFKLLSEKFHMDSSVAEEISISIQPVIKHQTFLQKERNVIISKRTFAATVDVRSIFREIHGNSSASFWLDSSSSGPVQGRSDGTTPLSIFGDLDSSKSSYAVEYHGSNRLTIRTPGQQTTENLNKNIFEYLDDKLENSKSVTDVLHFCNANDASSESMHRTFQKIETDSGPILPFNVTSAFFGFLGYEARHEATEILTRPYKDTYEKYNLSATHVEGFESSKWMNNLSHPMAFFMHPSQYTVYNHADNSIYVVTISDDTADGVQCAEISSLQLLDEIGAIVGGVVDDSSKESEAASNLQIQGLSDLYREAEIPSSQLSAGTKILYAVKSKEEYRSDIKKCLECIKAGQSYELCLTLQFMGEGAKKDGVKAKPLDVYESLRSKNPAPYSCFVHYDPVGLIDESSATSDSVASIESDPTLGWYQPGGFTICSSSPERYLKASKSGVIESKPIKGTARRDLLHPDLDAIIASDLKNDEKSQAENLMVVDLVRNDFGRVCEIGSVCVPDLMRVETFASVHQLVSTIRGKLQKGRSLIDAIVATFPGGSMTGAPKLRTMDIIEEIENRPRGIYSGAIGYLGLNGESDLNIVIRTAILVGDSVTVGSGGAIVALSEPDQEVDEVILKAQAVSRPLGCSLSFGTEDRS